MTTTKGIAFLLGLVSLAGLLGSGLLALGPTLVPIPPPPPLQGLSAGCLGAILFVFAAIPASLLGVLGLGLWLFVIQRQDAATAREAEALPRREEAFQARLDGLVHHLCESQGNTPAVSGQIQTWIEELTDAQGRRLWQFLFRCGLSEDRRDLPLNWGREKPAVAAREWNVRMLAQFLVAGGIFFLLWGAVVALTHLATDVLRIFGFEPGLEAAIFGSSGCFIVGLVAVLGGWGLRRLLRGEARRAEHLQGFWERAREIALDGCCRQIERLLLEPGARSKAERIARAILLSTLPELDGGARGHLLVWLHARDFLRRFDLRGVDFQGALLPSTDLSGACLAGADLSGARLTGAVLFRADLHQSCLRGADLQDIAAEAIDLRQADLRDAALLRSNLREADLRGADLAGANLWQADLTGVDLAQTSLAKSQLAVTRSHGGQRP